MGDHKPSRRSRCGGREPLNALVVPDVPSVQVDRGFWYAIPEGVAVETGTIVRVPLGSRVVRGWVVRTDPEVRDGLKPIRRVSGDHTIFSSQLLETLQWAAHHYVAPLSTLLKKAGPPNLPRLANQVRLPDVEQPRSVNAYTELGESAAAGRAGPATVVVASVRSDEILDACRPVLSANRSAMVVFPTGVEAARFGDAAEALGRRLVLIHPDMSDNQITTRWSRVRDTPGLLVVGTERVVLWPVAALAMAWVVGDGRRGLKARQMPTLHVRDVLKSRAATERFSLVLSGAVPSTEALAYGARRLTPSGRLWPRVEIIDRGEDPPGGGVIGVRARSALASAVKRGQTAFVFTHRHGYAPAFRCVGCRTLRVCGVCRARATNKTTCARCGADLGPCRTCAQRTFEPLGAGEGRVLRELGKALQPSVVGAVGTDCQVWVGTERDLPMTNGRSLAVAVDADGLIFGTNYRAGETALRLLARVAATVEVASGSRLMVQTSRPSNPVIQALQRGEPIGLLDDMIEERRLDGLPPFGELAVLDVTDAPSWMAEQLGQMQASVLGPLEHDGQQRWLIQDRSLREDKHILRKIVQDARDASARVRVDVDPIDL